MSEETHFHLHEHKPEVEPRIKTPPKTSAIPVPFDYCPSDDGTDENLLILLHGLGDTHLPFGRLGRQLKLPQTATIALRAPEQIPYLYEEAYQWYPSFDALGELLPQPNPTPALDLMSKVFAHLMEHCAWPPHRIHLFGFAQGGTVAAEFALQYWPKAISQAASSSSSSVGIGGLGSAVSISGPLLSFPTLSERSSTPVLLFHRPSSAESALLASALSAFRKAFTTFVDVQMRGSAEGMPRSREEWESIMRFWSERLGKRKIEGFYEVMSGTAS